MTAKQFIGSTPDSTYMAITEVMGIVADAQDQADFEALLVISLSGPIESAVLGGNLTSEKITRIQALLDELKWRAAEKGDGETVLRVFR
jgi:hypothetical protein